MDEAPKILRAAGALLPLADSVIHDLGADNVPTDGAPRRGGAG
jgi:hypothetical protein